MSDRIFRVSATYLNLREALATMLQVAELTAAKLGHEDRRHQVLVLETFFIRPQKLAEQGAERASGAGPTHFGPFESLCVPRRYTRPLAVPT